MNSIAEEPYVQLTTLTRDGRPNPAPATKHTCLSGPLRDRASARKAREATWG